MPRQARIDAPGALHHIICRGIERRNIFRDDTDRDNFVLRLGKLLLCTSTRCFAWALIPNHFHLLLETGAVPIATVMRRLLTGYTVTFNLRHHRCGHLFQNRYKSILCQKESYLLELVRYIHLNPLRSDLVRSLSELVCFRYCGHYALLSPAQNNWQETTEVLLRFSEDTTEARSRYSSFIRDGIETGRKPDLTGGGLVRSVGGWDALRAALHAGEFLKSDERILGDNEFVEAVLSNAEEQVDKKTYYKANGIDLETAARRAAALVQVPVDEIWQHKKRPLSVMARSLFCYWGTHHLEIPATTIAKRLGLTPSAVCRAAERGERLAAENQWNLT